MNAGAADFAGGEGVIGVKTELGGEIEGDGEAGDALGKEESIAAIALFGCAKAGVLAHGPKTFAIHVRINPTGVWERSGLFGTVFGHENRS